MSDSATLVERLRERSASYMMGGPSSAHTSTMLDEAAARIAELEGALADQLARLTARQAAYFEAAREYEDEIDRLKAALAEIGGMADIGLNIGPAIRTAQAALSGEGVT